MKKQIVVDIEVDDNNPLVCKTACYHAAAGPYAHFGVGAVTKVCYQYNVERKEVLEPNVSERIFKFFRCEECLKAEK